MRMSPETQAAGMIKPEVDGKTGVGAARAPNSCIYFAPCLAGQVLRVSPEALAAESITPKRNGECSSLPTESSRRTAASVMNREAAKYFGRVQRAILITQITRYYLYLEKKSPPQGQRFSGM